jgi:ribonuclease Y
MWKHRRIAGAICLALAFAGTSRPLVGQSSANPSPQVEDAARRERLVEAKDEAFRMRSEAEADAKRRIAEVDKKEDRLSQRESVLDDRAGALDRRDRFPAGYDEARVDSFQDKERVYQIIQMMLLSGRVVRYAADRASGRDRVREILTGILGDYAPARRALTAGFLWSLFKP